MRHALTGLLVFLLTSGQAHAFFKICNKSNEEVYVAIGYHEDEQWLAEGWWSVPPADCRNIINGSLTKRYYYIRGEGVNGKVWSGEYSFCTTNEKFTLADSPDCVSSRVDREGFFQVDTGESSDWTTNLTD